MNPLESFERFFEGVMEGTVGRIFRSPIQPAEIGRRLERAMESGQVVSVDGIIVPNDYQVFMNPADMVVFADFVPALCRQMESWLADLAIQREYVVIDDLRLQIEGDDSVGRRAIQVECAIAELPPHVRAERDRAQRTEIYRVVQAVGATDVPPQILRFANGEYAGETIILRRPVITIGRALDNDVIIDSAEVSRHHARIDVHQGVYTVIDLGSTNGTAVNGRAADHTRLQHGDRVTLGTVALEFLPYAGPALLSAAS